MRNEAILQISMSFLVALFVYSSLATYPINILSSVFVFLLVIFFQRYFYNSKKSGHAISMKAPFTPLVYGLGLITSLVVILVPTYDVHLGTEHMWQTFTSLPLPALARIVSAYFILGFFPGYAVYDSFMREQGFDSFENFSLVYAFSYIFNVLTCLTLYAFGLDITPQTLVGCMWIFVVLLQCLHYIQSEEPPSLLVEKKQCVTLDFEASWLILIGITIVVFAYFQAFYVRPFGGWFHYDVPRYMIFANEFMHFGPIVRAPYIWPNVFIWIAHRITGLPMMYAYVGLQFYQLILPFSFYTVMHTLLKSRKLAIVGTFVLFFATSTNALIMVFTRIGLSGVFEAYLKGGALERWKILTYYFWQKVGMEFSFPAFWSPRAVDFIMTFLAMTFAYRYLSGNNRGKLSLILMGLFTATALYSHNIQLTLIILLSILIYSLILNLPRGVMVKTLGSVLIFGLSFELLSRFYFFNYKILPVFLATGGNLLQSLLDPIFFVPTLGLAVYALLMIVRKRFFIRKLRKCWGIRRKVMKILELNPVKFFLWSLGPSIVLLATYLTLTDFGNLSYLDQKWYTNVFKSFMLSIPILIGCLPCILKKLGSYSSSHFLLSWIASFLLGMCISLVLPELSEAEPIRFYSILLSLPIASLTTLGIESFRVLSRRHLYIMFLRQVRLFLLVFLIAVSFLSFAYMHEMECAYVMELTNASEIEAYEWMNNNLAKGETILPLSERSYLTLTSMVSNVRVLPIMQEYSPGWFSHSWLKDVLINSSSSEAIVYTLYRLNVSYVYATENDLATLRGATILKSLLEAFPIVFNNNVARLYSVPSYSLYEDSNYVLVDSTLDHKPMNWLKVFNLLTATGVKFSIIPDIQLDTLTQDHVYFFPSNQHLPHELANNINELVHYGAHVVFCDPSFASYDELDERITLNTIRRLSDALSSWHFEEGSGNTVHDNIKRNGSIHGATWVEGKLGKALAFDGSSDYVELPENFLSMSDFLDGGSFEFWFRGGAQRKNAMLISIKGVWIIYLGMDGRLSFDIDGSSSSPSTVSEKSFDDNRWHHVLATWDNDINANALLYVDEILQGSSLQNTYDIELLNRTSSFGSQYDGKDLYYDGSIDEIRISRTFYTASMNLGNGTLTFLDLSSLGPAHLRTSHGQLLLDTFGNILSHLPSPNTPGLSMSLPYPPDLFRYLIPMPNSVWYLTGLHGYLFCDDGTVVSGQITISSSSIHLIHHEITTSELIISNDTDEMRFQETKLNKLRIKGSGEIYSENSQIVFQSEGLPGGLIRMHIKPTEHSKLHITHVKGEIEIERNGLPERFFLSGENLTMVTAEEFAVLIEQPIITINGSLDSTLYGSISYENRFYVTEKRKRLLLEGQFEIKPLYDSGKINIKILSISGLSSFPPK